MDMEDYNENNLRDRFTFDVNVDGLLVRGNRKRKIFDVPA
jgi:hypothetical protein